MQTRITKTYSVCVCVKKRKKVEQRIVRKHSDKFLFFFFV